MCCCRAALDFVRVELVICIILYLACTEEFNMSCSIFYFFSQSVRIFFFTWTFHTSISYASSARNSTSRAFPRVVAITNKSRVSRWLPHSGASRDVEVILNQLLIGLRKREGLISLFFSLLGRCSLLELTLKEAAQQQMNLILSA